jgi:hypothetical protein
MSSVYEIVAFEKRQFQLTAETKWRFLAECLMFRRNFLNILLATVMHLSFDKYCPTNLNISYSGALFCRRFFG